MWYDVPCSNVVLQLLLRKLNCLRLAIKSHLNNDVNDGLIESYQRGDEMMTTSFNSENLNVSNV